MTAKTMRRQALRPQSIASKPVRVDPAFADPEAVLELVRNLGPYPSVGTYTNGGTPDPETASMPWYLVEPDSDLLVQNPNWVTAAKKAFDSEIVEPIRCVVNLNPPAPINAPHLDLPVYRGFSVPEIPTSFLMTMSNSGLFVDWLVPLASGIAWFWQGEGGEFEYWPEGPDGASVVERPPLWNVGVISDNEAMWHRVRAIGPAARATQRYETVPGASQMHWAGDCWEIRDAGSTLARFAPSEVRISFVWKGYVFKDEAHYRSFEDRSYDLTMDQVIDIFQDDLAKRGKRPPRPSDALNDREWRALLDHVYTPLQA